MKKIYIIPKVDFEELQSEDDMLSASNPKYIATIDHTKDPEEEYWNQPGLVGPLDGTDPVDGIGDWIDDGF